MGSWAVNGPCGPARPRWATNCARTPEGEGEGTQFQEMWAEMGMTNTKRESAADTRPCTPPPEWGAPVFGSSDLVEPQGEPAAPRVHRAPCFVRRFSYPSRNFRVVGCCVPKGGEGLRHPRLLSTTTTAIATWLGALSRSHGRGAHGGVGLQGW